MTKKEQLAKSAAAGHPGRDDLFPREALELMWLKGFVAAQKMAGELARNMADHNYELHDEISTLGDEEV